MKFFRVEAGGVVGGNEAESHGRTERDAAGRVMATHHTGHVVAAGVQAGNGLAGAIQAWQFSFIDPFTMFNLGVALVPIAGALLGASLEFSGEVAGNSLSSSES